MADLKPDQPKKVLSVHDDRPFLPVGAMPNRGHIVTGIRGGLGESLTGDELCKRNLSSGIEGTIEFVLNVHPDTIDE
jgi:hypothetical protein